jgi:hypothetical protein
MASVPRVPVAGASGPVRAKHPNARRELIILNRHDDPIQFCLLFWLDRLAQRIWAE